MINKNGMTVTMFSITEIKELIKEVFFEILTDGKVIDNNTINTVLIHTVTTINENEPKNRTLEDFTSIIPTIVISTNDNKHYTVNTEQLREILEIYLNVRITSVEFVKMDSQTVIIAIREIQSEFQEFKIIKPNKITKREIY